MTSPGTRSGSRLVAMIVSPGADRSKLSASRAVVATRCSQLSITSSKRGRREVVHDRVDDGLARQRPNVERGGDRVGDERGVGERGKLDEGAPVAMRWLGAACQLERKPGLADAAGSDERQQPCTAQERPQLAELTAAPDERARGRGQRRRSILGFRFRPESGELLSQRGGQLRELFATLSRPVVVAILGQQLAAVERQCRPIGSVGPSTSRSGGGELESVDVELGCQLKYLLTQLDRSGAERAPRDVHGLMKVVGGRRRFAVSPQHVHRLLAVQTVRGREAPAASPVLGPSSAAKRCPARARRRPWRRSR